MKRDEALRPLSREHLVALLAAKKLKEADDLGGATRTFLDFWQGDGKRHFRVEEEVLLPAYVRDGGADATEEAIARVLTDHVWIRARIGALRESPDAPVEELRELGRRLDDHVRHCVLGSSGPTQAERTDELMAAVGRLVKS